MLMQDPRCVMAATTTARFAPASCRTASGRAEGARVVCSAFAGAVASIMVSAAVVPAPGSSTVGSSAWPAASAFNGLSNAEDTRERNQRAHATLTAPSRPLWMPSDTCGTGRSSLTRGWRRLAVGGWRRLAADGGWQLVVGGGWRLAVGGWWRLAVGDCPSGLSLTKRKLGFLISASLHVCVEFVGRSQECVDVWRLCGGSSFR